MFASGLACCSQQGWSYDVGYEAAFVVLAAYGSEEVSMSDIGEVECALGVIQPAEVGCGLNHRVFDIVGPISDENKSSLTKKTVA